MKRSIAPVFWLLFGAGGMLAALAGPALVLITGLAAPTGIGVFARPHVDPRAPLPLQNIPWANSSCSA